MRLFGFCDHLDPLAEASNKVALILAGNTPFYPLYLYFILGRHGLPWYLLSAASLPFFAATFWVIRRHALAGRIWLCLVAIANSLFVTWLMGEPSGTALFLLPCISLCVLSFRGGERPPALLLTGIPFLAYYALHGNFPPAPVRYDPAEDHSLMILNEISVASVTAALAYLYAAARERSQSG